ncbi:Na+/H+ antiporter NhaC family protein [Furfurilactobacillus curtus]|uniref:Na+/H+ antiporter NhaC n=1 Tax=Furfurilactobacillus curtus TaxID=1746200 RepID=A0ABQ5JLI8_9LACO
MKKDERVHLEFGLAESLITLIVMFSLLGILIIHYKMAPQIPILLVFTLIMFYGHLRGFSWDEIFNGIVEGITPGIIPIIIFLMIGLLVASWLASGTIATIMVIGFRVLSIKFFLPTIFLICGLIGITVGSAFTTISTMGIAFMGIGHVLGFPAPIVTGAIVSGAFLGNNMSPLSDTSNLTTGIAQVDLYVHLKNMSQSVIPAAVIAMAMYFFIGTTTHVADLKTIHEISNTLGHSFLISGWSLIPIIVLLLLAWRKVPAVPSLLVGALTAIAMVLIESPGIKINKIGLILMSGYHATTGVSTVNKIMSGGGIDSMLGSISLIICALSLGGLLIKFGVVHGVIDSIQRFVNTPGRLILMTALSGIGINFAVGEQYLSIILPGTTFKGAYHRLGLDPKYLSRTLATAGADINALVPWGVSGVFISGTLNVNPLKYIPFAFYPYLNPLMTIILGFSLVSWKYRKKRQRS